MGMNQQLYRSDRRGLQPGFSPLHIACGLLSFFWFVPLEQLRFQFGDCPRRRRLQGQVPHLLGIVAQIVQLPVKSFNYMTEIVLVGSFKNMTKRASAFQFW
jgi:hypothetical protein